MTYQALEIAKPGPDFSLPGTDGKTYTLGDIRGEKGTALVFSCNHCPYVLAYEDRLIALAKEYQPQGIGWAFLCANNAETHPADSFEKMKEHAAEKGFVFPYLRDESQQTALAYGAAHTPEVFLLAADGTLAYHGRIDDNWENPEAVTTSEFRDALQALVTGKAVPVTTTFAIGCSIKWKPENKPA